ncbi:MAG: glycosyltransferase [Elusimicrobia bacterium]|nr:glycosyltransferase [Elusimicrobiota bacterium]
MARVLVFVPTYNERDNVEKLLNEILSQKLDADVLFCDDASPDGTGELLDRLAKEHPRLHVLHRKGKEGIGTAHQAGIAWAYDRGYELLVTMDADFTHPPSFIPRFLERAGETDVVVGSRYLQKDSLDEWNLFRWSLTKLGHFLTVVCLGLPYDATGAFRAYRLDRIPRRLFGLVRSPGYSFFFESLYALHSNRFKIVEVPIVLPARTYGTSKMALSEVFGSLRRLVSLYGRRLAGDTMRLSSEADAPTPATWDRYWRKRQSVYQSVYDPLASLYRRWIIRPAFNQFLLSAFRPGSRLLHAGCGSGQVDEDVFGVMRIAALDISQPALALYRRANGKSARVLQGDIFQLPFADGSFDGIYNLGVMEHFTEDDIVRILAEFRRVLRAGGKALLFWPHYGGISVRLFRLLDLVANRILHLNVEFHPKELTLLRSKQQAEGLLTRAGFTLEEYYFGPKDFFTQVALVATSSDGRGN